MNMLEWALKYILLGFSVIPIYGVDPKKGCYCKRGISCPSPGKHPSISQGVYGALRDERAIRGCYHVSPDANVGIRTGFPYGPLVLDIDPRNGGAESLDRLIEELGPLPATAEVLTGGGGRHLYFKSPGFKIKSTHGLFGNGLDVQAENAYVVAPPSVHFNGRTYEWEISSDIFSTPMAELPQAWLARISSSKGTHTISRRKDWAAFSKAKIPEGERNSRLTQVTGLLLGKNVDPFLTLDLLQAYNLSKCMPPLCQEEVCTIVNSISKLEINRRRD